MNNDTPIPATDFANTTMTATDQRNYSQAVVKLLRLRAEQSEQHERDKRAEWRCFFHFACENSVNSGKAD